MNEEARHAGSLLRVADTSRRVAETSGRNAKIELLADCLRELKNRELAVAASYLSGLLPQGKIGVGYRAVQAASQVQPAEAADLSLLDLDGYLDRLESLAGKGSVAARRAQLSELFGRAVPSEQAFLAALLVGNLRQGALESLVVDALAKAFGANRARVRRALMFAPSVAQVAVAASSDDATALDAFDIQLLRPVSPMLAQTAESLDEAHSAFDDMQVELKLDGARIQVHKQDDEVRVFTRQLNDVTASVPEVVDVVRRAPARSIILDGEVIAMRADGRPERFQTTMKRFGRRIDVAQLQEQIPLTPYFFDCLYIDGQSLLDEPLSRRTPELAQLFPHSTIAHLVRPSADQAAEFLADALKRGHEGVMAKSLAAPYRAGSRGAEWLKLKHVHTLDLVVIAAEWGSGRRKGYLSNLHLAARDPDGGFVMLGKTFKGMTDAILVWQTEQLLARQIERDGHVVHVRPELVVEIAFNDVQQSPHYPGGLALRFARLRRYRDDKAASEADTISAVRTLFEAG